MNGQPRQSVEQGAIPAIILRSRPEDSFRRAELVEQSCGVPVEVGTPSSRATLRDLSSATHCGQRQCSVCKKMFSTRYNLRVHMRIHTNSSPFGCRFCGKEFRTKGNLEAHLQVLCGIVRDERLTRSCFGCEAKDARLTDAE
mmetsp:Transcript_3690/g.7119  ORF Transcript_3690/g.7119 Transcript_3690/m.7119 type:complete len:142 (-) Transcript_3690:2912-3337(-)